MATPKKKKFGIKLVSGRKPAYGIVFNFGPNKGSTLLEVMITLILVGILLAIAFSVMSRFIAWSRLNIATFQLS